MMKMGFWQNYGKKAQKKELQAITISCNPLIYLARPVRLERTACGFEVRRSIQLSYGRLG